MELRKSWVYATTKGGGCFVVDVRGGKAEILRQGGNLEELH